MSKEKLAYSASAGMHIEKACEEALDMAITHDSVVSTRFNGIDLEVSPTDSVEGIVDRYTDESNRRSEKWKKSPEYIAQERKRKAEITNKQGKIDALLGNLSNMLSHPHMLMRWIKEFALLSDDVGVTFSHTALIEKLEAHGFIENHHVGHTPEWFSTQNRMAEYIIGQVLNCLKKGMPPHPVTATFVDRYFDSVDVTEDAG